MNKILKYELNNLDTGELREVTLPQGARVLTVGAQTKVTYGLHTKSKKTTVCLWAMSNTEESKTVRRMFRIYGTGKPINEDPLDLDYIGTVQTGPFVWHVFERKEPK